MKRKRKSGGGSHVDKCPKIDDSDLRPSYALLRQYYPEVLTLRNYLVSRLPKTAKRRRRRIRQYGLHCGSESPSEDGVVDLLDKTLVGSFASVSSDTDDSIEKDLTIFTQHLNDVSVSTLNTQCVPNQSEIVHFVVWLLFRRHCGGHRPQHILCQGYQRTAVDSDLIGAPDVPGIYSNSQNQHVERLGQHPWTALPSLIGNRADRLISELLIGCGVFVPIENSNNYSQLSGKPLCDLKVLRIPSNPGESNTNERTVAVENTNLPTKRPRGLSEIRFVRQRMLYSRPTTSGHAKIVFGLGPVHVLNRKRDTNDLAETISIAKYIFPREFGLHNVFTSQVDARDTSQAYKDYTLREKEIARVELRRRKSHPNAAIDRKQPLPKRVKGEILNVIHRIRKRHQRCPYHALLHHYCPRRTDADGNMNESVRQASTAVQVSAFCCAVLFKVFPPDLWGPGQTGEHNKNTLMHNIDKFVRLRRYESMSLHNVLQSMHINGIPWLMPSNADPEAKMSLTDFGKRQQLMAEMIYYVFDSFLIPLIRNNFHVTESTAQRNQLFYFRHDVWRALSEPAFTMLKDKMFEECNTEDLQKTLARRALGVSQVRMLPKEKGMRPIINLRRRVHRLKFGELVLGKSINSLLTPAFSVLNFERDTRPWMLGSALFSVHEMFPRLQAFRQTLSKHGLDNAPLYFANVDVQACFDTIPQKRLMKLVKTIISADQYQISKYSRVKLIGGDQDTPGFGAKPSWKFLTKAAAGKQRFDFAREVSTDSAHGRTKTIYVDGIAQRVERRRAILDLLDEHIGANVIKLGNRYYRQKEGIPQGSIVSTLLCSYMYGELEHEALSFLRDNSNRQQSVLLRLIDDFLVISTSRSVAERFMQTMHAGLPQFGVQVKAEKSRANFEVGAAAGPVVRLPSSTDFPFCGHAINTTTLSFSKDVARRQRANLAEAITVEFTRLPGQTFYRKTLNALKIQMHGMLLSTKYNTPETVLGNLRHAFHEVATKTYFYIKSLDGRHGVGLRLIIKAVDDMIKLAVALMQRRRSGSKQRRDMHTRTSDDETGSIYECAVSRAQTRGLACEAFRDVFSRRQTRFKGLIAWLEAQLALPVIKAARQGRS
ncbi:Hypothetical protein R9X50_00667800 [Acrodontium crateriforme]|uniref:Telomerase reverse transcriptase n=1 Tax=Acrodontium crateriforme TaxID=150365 RepID=A0AAQ3RCA4_9PEZI|nr:Hypothetical protein R9X50_00667800 [Acrodontium crateriforme]